MHQLSSNKDSLAHSQIIVHQNYFGKKVLIKDGFKAAERLEEVHKLALVRA